MAVCCSLPLNYPQGAISKYENAERDEKILPKMQEAYNAVSRHLQER